jgi:hypothetical protein
MNQNNLARLLALAIAIVLAVGIADSALGRQWDLFAVMLLALGLHLWAVGMSKLGRPLVGLRRDLTEWLRQRSQVTGEPIPALTDRAVAQYKDRYGRFDPQPRP